MQRLTRPPLSAQLTKALEGLEEYLGPIREDEAARRAEEVVTEFEAEVAVLGKRVAVFLCLTPSYSTIQPPSIQ